MVTAHEILEEITGHAPQQSNLVTNLWRLIETYNQNARPFEWTYSGIPMQV
jgi:hypothetical protein